MTNEFALVFAKHQGKFTLVPFCKLTKGDYLPTIHRTISVGSHRSGDSTFDDWLLYDDKDESWFPEDLEWNDEDLDELWAEFGDVPMNPETECIESDWLHFPAGTNREEIWHWFEDTFDCRVADLMYGVRESRRTEAPLDKEGTNVKSISVNTAFGELCAVVGGDTEFPEIIVYLKNETGNTLLLAAVTDNTVLGEDSEVYGLRTTVFGDPCAEDYSDYFVLTHEQLDSPLAMWE